jgi:hypothetical protein
MSLPAPASGVRQESSALSRGRAWPLPDVAVVALKLTLHLADANGSQAGVAASGVC